MMSSQPLQTKAKVIATLGPASSEETVLRSLIQAGVNIIRLNMSHGLQEQHQTNIRLIRRLSEELQVPLAIMADLQGPKLRTGILKDHQPVTLIEGSTIHFEASAEPGDAEMITTPNVELIEALQAGDIILINDGRIKLQVAGKMDNRRLECKILQGGLLEERKGINVPEISMGLRVLTEKDQADALFAAKEGVDFLALSFVRKADDIHDLRNFIQDHGLECPPIIAKIEKPQALNDIENILFASHAIMVARGDLGVELPAECVPAIQKELAEKAAMAEKPVIIATQMLESMIWSHQPTRAEVSDVANGVFDGADALMLSGETAMGKYPVEAVKTMRQIIAEAEKTYRKFHIHPPQAKEVSSPNFYHVIAHSASYASWKADVKAIIVLSTSGRMAQRVSKLKPPHPIIALTPNLDVFRRMSLLWGVIPLMIPDSKDTEETIWQTDEVVLKSGVLSKGDSVVFCAGSTAALGTTNMLRIYRLGEPNVTQ